MSKSTLNSPPPSLAQKLLSWFIKDELAEEVLGDLEEQYIKTATHRSVRHAKLIYWYQVLHYLRPFALKNYKSNSNYLTMYQHNVKLTYRNFLKYKSSLFINLIGLTSGITCALLIFLWVSDELSVDKFHAKDKQLYQVFLHHEESGSLRSGPATPGQLAETLQAEFPEIITAVEDTDTKWFANNFTLHNEDEVIKVPGKFCGKDYFSLFSYKLKQGQPSQVLQNKTSIVISESLALKLFGTTQGVIGKPLKWQLLHEKGDATIAGVFEDLPVNCTESFEFALSFENFKDIIGDGMHWGNYNAYNFVEVAEGTDIVAFNEKIKNLIKEKRPGINVTPFLVKFSDLYLHSNFENGQQIGGRIVYVKLFSVIAAFILAIACINFMNLTTARASRRTKEIGVKKSLGASRKSLVGQYLSEAVIIALIALVLSFIITASLLPFFNQLTGKQLTLQLTSELLLPALGIALATGLLAGSYPALYLSGFRPINILKGQLKTSFGEVWTRKGLVVFQFTLSVIMIVCVVVVYKQIEFIQTKNLGLKRENVLKIPVEGNAVGNLETFFNELQKVPNVLSASSSSHSFIAGTNSTTGVHWEGKDPDVEILFEQAHAYYNLVETLGIEMVAGRGFSNEFADESNKIVFNETAIATMGIEDPIGKTVKMWGDEKEIIGVMKDFNYASLHEKVGPMLFHYSTRFLPNAYIRISGNDVNQTIKDLSAFYAKFNPGFTFEYEFLDQNYQEQYLTEQRIAVLAQAFAGIAIMISCLGLFGLAAFTAERRQKEIGIRKILGAADVSIIALLTNDFTKMVGMAIIIAIPVSFYLTDNWLGGFAYHIELKWWFFALAGLSALLIAWLTVGFQTAKAATINPVDCLKNE